MNGGARHTRVGRRTVHARFTDRRDGDMGIDVEAEALDARRAAIAPTPWTWLEQVHGADVVVVTRPGEHAGARADAAVTAVAGATLAVQTADCAGVLLRGEPVDGGPQVIGAAHAGWRGLEQGVLESTVAAMRELGAVQVRWRLGPCISPAAYEFGAVELERLATRLGSGVIGRTTEGAPALDLRAGVAAALSAAGASAEPGHGAEVPCTASDTTYYSWRARRDSGRQAAVTWIEAA